MLPRPFVLPFRQQSLRPWLPATGALVAAVLLASAASHVAVTPGSATPDAPPSTTLVNARLDALRLPKAMPAPPAERPDTAMPATVADHTSAAALASTTDHAPTMMSPATLNSLGPNGVTASTLDRASNLSVAPTTVHTLPSVAIHAVRLGAATLAQAPTQAGTPTMLVDATTNATSTTVGTPIPATTSASVSTAAAEPGTSLALVAAAWVIALAMLMAGAVIYLVRALPRLSPHRAAVTTGTACGALALAGLALAAWADAGMAGALLSGLLVALPGLTLLSGHGGYALGRAHRASRPGTATRGAARRSGGLPSDAASTGTMLPAADQTETAAQPTADRVLLGNFRIEGELGRGAMGVVYLGRHQRTGQRVALKTLAIAAHRDGIDGAEAQRRFLREAAMATRLRHPDIVAVVGSGEQQGLAYIAMEYVDGHDLCRHTRADALLPLPVLVDAMARVADALAYAHAQGVIHRDIKPANLMWNPVTRQVKVADFGVARVVDGGRTSTGVLMGTPTHLAPEQLAGRQLDGRTDLYALGVTLYQLITGQLPQRAESMARLMFEIANVQAPDVRRLRPDTPPALATIVARLLEKRPDDRYADGRALAADLRGVLVAAVPTTAPPGGHSATQGIAPPLATGHNSVF